MKTEELILNSLLCNDDYARKVIPQFKEEYFRDPATKAIYGAIEKYFQNHNKIPTKNVIGIELSNNRKLPERVYNLALEQLEAIPALPSGEDIAWLEQQTEAYMQEAALSNALAEALDIASASEHKNLSKGAIPGILQEALSVSFDNNIGHDYLGDVENRWEKLHAPETRVPLRLAIFNAITKGGFPPKSLNIFMASTGVGKSMLMCDAAAYDLACGNDVLYITLEMAEERIAERIDANLLDMPLDEFENISREDYVAKMAQLKKRVNGRLIIKEYPTGSAGANQFRFLLHELDTKQNFKPKIIYIDYINICASSRVKMGSTNSYGYIKAIAEELRGLGVEFNVPVVSATQSNRGGFQNSDVDLDDTSDSFGLPMTADWMVALMTDELLDSQGQIMVKQLKNRYVNMNGKYKRFLIGVDKPKMRTYDLEDSAQDQVMKHVNSGATTEGKFKSRKTVNASTAKDDAPAFDKGSFGSPKKAVAADDFDFD